LKTFANISIGVRTGAAAVTAAATFIASTSYSES